MGIKHIFCIIFNIMVCFVSSKNDIMIVRMLPTCGNHFHDRIMSYTWDDWDHIISLTSTNFN